MHTQSKPPPSSASRERVYHHPNPRVCSARRVDLRTTFARVTPLFLAAAVAGAGASPRSGRDAAGVVRALLRAGAAVDAADELSGMTPLAAAAAGGASWGSLDAAGWYDDAANAAGVVAELLRGGAAVRAPDNAGRTPLHYALQVGGAASTFRKNWRGGRPADVACALLAAGALTGELNAELRVDEVDRVWTALRARVEDDRGDGARSILRCEMSRFSLNNALGPSPEFCAVVEGLVREECARVWTTKEVGELEGAAVVRYLGGGAAPAVHLDWVQEGTGARAAQPPPGAKLPGGWEAVSDEVGAVKFVHSSTGRAQYAAPADAARGGEPLAAVTPAAPPPAVPDADGLWFHVREPLGLRLWSHSPSEEYARYGNPHFFNPRMPVAPLPAPLRRLDAAVRARAHFRYRLRMKKVAEMQHEGLESATISLEGIPVSFAAFEFLHFAFAYGEHLNEKTSRARGATGADKE